MLQKRFTIHHKPSIRAVIRLTMRQVPVNMPRACFFKLRTSLKVVIDNDVTEEMKKKDLFWKIRPFLVCICQGCLLNIKLSSYLIYQVEEDSIHVACK
ncbi:hypothetical protein ANANG_G00039300 [Anguilla anguilla]|uniref:Uncharacterized protein n=1 Tax=Anguilla anguilla TaxID=7936 RepID=A0A9D3S969_ANGAN|nr:hypothetical protein ANANG_G00039300 [Anguilla anguilla]